MLDKFTSMNEWSEIITQTHRTKFSTHSLFELTHRFKELKSFRMRKIFSVQVESKCLLSF